MQTDILRRAYDFWIGPLPTPEYFPEDRSKIWFEKSDATDDHIRREFGSALDMVATTDWPLDELTRQEAVGLVIFLDQFPRNMFRESPAAFAYDSRAREIAGALLNRNLTEYHPCERMFLGLPFVHSESLADQDRAVQLAEALAASTGGHPFFNKSLDLARQHRDLIAQFHRFPHRNGCVGRQSTQEEMAFMEKHGRGF